MDCGFSQIWWGCSDEDPIQKFECVQSEPFLRWQRSKVDNALTRLQTRSLEQKCSRRHPLTKPKEFGRKESNGEDLVCKIKESFYGQSRERSGYLVVTLVFYFEFSFLPTSMPCRANVAGCFKKNPSTLFFYSFLRRIHSELRVCRIFSFWSAGTTSSDPLLLLLWARWSHHTVVYPLRWIFWYLACLSGLETRMWVFHANDLGKLPFKLETFVQESDIKFACCND